MLLALRDKEGTVLSGTMYNFAIGGAILAELLMKKRIDVEEVRKKTFARVLDPAPVGDPLIDECLSRIAGGKKRAQLRDWVSRFAQTKNLKHRVAEQLARHRILRVDEDKVLWIFTRNLSVDPARAGVHRATARLSSVSGEIGPRTVVLLSLVGAGLH
jgi:hypothetical protein